jgi:hypothetical protein
VGLRWKQLGETIGGHFGGGNPFYGDGAGFNLLAEPVIVDIDVAKLGAKLRLLLGEKVNGLLVVAIDVKS